MTTTRLESQEEIFSEEDILNFIKLDNEQQRVVLLHALSFENDTNLCTLIECVSRELFNEIALLETGFLQIFLSKARSQAVIDSFFKVLSQEALDKLMLREFEGLTPFHYVAYSPFNLNVCALLKYSSSSVINEMASIVIHGHNLLHGYITSPFRSYMVLQALLSQLNPSLRESLILVPGEGGVSVLDICLGLPKIDENDNLIGACVIQSVSDEALKNYALSNSPRNIIDILLEKTQNQFIVQNILSRLDEATIATLVNKRKPSALISAMLTGNPTAQYILKHVDAKTLYDLINDTEGFAKRLHQQGKSSDEIITKYTYVLLQAISEKNSDVFNELMRILLAEGFKINLTVKSLHALTPENLSHYLASHPEYKIKDFEEAKPFSFFRNAAHEQFVANLNQAQQLMNEEVGFLLKAYNESAQWVPNVLADLTTQYLNGNKTVARRVNYEIALQKRPGEINALEEKYEHLEKQFNHDADAQYKHNESAIVLSYLSSQSDFPQVAIHQAKQASSLTNKVKQLTGKLFDRVKSLRGKKEELDVGSFVKLMKSPN